MKKILKFLAVVVLCGFSTPAFSAMTLGGTYVCTNSKCFMPMLITETGVLQGTRSEFLQVTIKGSANLDRCIMRKEVTSHGTLIANATEFLMDLSVCAGKTTLTSCNLMNLYVLDQNEENSENPIHITLNGATTVNGAIVFATGLGQVYKGPNVVILGEVIGGVIVDQEN
jgi:hypothetical protein